MAQDSISPPPRLDPLVLARLTGDLGDNEGIGKLCAEIGQAICEFLPDVLEGETGLVPEISFQTFDVGFKRQLVEKQGKAFAFTDVVLRGWCPDFAIGCGTPLVLTLIEAMLGADPATIDEPQARALSKIELDVADMVISKIAYVLRSIVTEGGGYEPLLGKAHNAADRPKPPQGDVDVYAASIVMNISVGIVKSSFCIVIPQKYLLKTKVISPKARNGNGKSKKEWTEQITEQVRRSQVTIEARIRLQSLTLGTVSRLQVGDVIPFFDKKDVNVNVNANGKDLYVGEFGRSGAKYTVRVQDTFGSEEDLLQHLMG